MKLNKSVYNMEQEQIKEKLIAGLDEKIQGIDIKIKQKREKFQEDMDKETEELEVLRFQRKAIDGYKGR